MIHAKCGKLENKTIRQNSYTEMKSEICYQWTWACQIDRKQRRLIV